MTLDTIIKSGTIVSAQDTFMADAGILDGRIAAIEPDLTDAAEIIDATDLLITPGGIDSEVYIC